VRTVREACERRGIGVDVVGAGSNRVEAHTERVLGAYDIVFAKARSAMEAMACGAAVIACDAVGMAGMVTSENYAAWRALNFGVRTLQRPITIDGIGEEIDRYDCESARAISARLRADADMEQAIDAIVKVYQRCVSETAKEPFPAQDRFKAVSAYL